MEGTANLDAIDYAILEALQKNARLSNKELAAEVGLAQSSCLARVTRLRETGVLFVHGSGFGQKAGTHHFRVVFLPPEDILTTAFDRLDTFVRERYLTGAHPATASGQP